MNEMIDMGAWRLRYEHKYIEEPAYALPTVRAINYGWTTGPTYLRVKKIDVRDGKLQRLWAFEYNEWGGEIGSDAEIDVDDIVELEMTDAAGKPTALFCDDPTLDRLIKEAKKNECED